MWQCWRNNEPVAFKQYANEIIVVNTWQNNVHFYRHSLRQQKKYNGPAEKILFGLVAVIFVIFCYLSFLFMGFGIRY